MKKTNIKINKRKLVARVMLLVLLLMSALNLGACDMKYKYLLTSERYVRGGNYLPGHFVATSNTTLFDKNDITFNIAYATHQIQEKNPKDEYPNHYGANPTMYFGLYISPDAKTDEEFWAIENQTFDDINAIQNFEDYTFINGITDEEAFTDEYALIPTPFFISDGSIYNHTEEVTIPQEYVTEKYGKFFLRFVCFYYNKNTNKFDYVFMRGIEFNYYEVDENTIEIKFNKNDFMHNEL